jgi:hypothetical protein
VSIDSEERFKQIEGLLVPLINDGEWLAESTVAFVRRLRVSCAPRRRRFPIPPNLIIELGAIIRIAMWQRDGVAVKLGVDFSPAEELLRGWLNQVFRGDRTALESHGTPLYDRVQTLWFQRCSWSAAPLLGSDIVVDRVEVERLLEFWERMLAI